MIRNIFLMLTILSLVSPGAMAQPDLQSALNNEARSEADKARDAGRKPAEVMEFLGVTAGMTTIDVIAASGYYTEVLSNAVGGQGKVYAQNPASVLKFRDGANDLAMTARLADNRLPNVIRWDHEFADLGIEAGTIDVAITALNLHDVYNASGEETAIGFAKGVLAILKPGGIFGVIDHDGSAANDNSALHRMQMSQAITVLEAAGFSISATSELLKNSEDDLASLVFAPQIRGNTSRFLIKAQKPAM